MPIDPSTAFVSYAREDLEFVLRLTKDLKAKGAKVWMDKLDILPGQPWDDKVEIAVEHCARMIVVLSPTSVTSAKVKNEFMDALDLGKIVIPVLFRECKIPQQLRRLQYADFRVVYDAGLTELLASLTALNEAAESVIADQPRLEEEHKKVAAAAQPRLEQEHERLEQLRLEEERKKAEEQARLEEKQKAAAEQDRLLEERQRQEQLEVKRKQAAEQARLDEARQHAAERARLEQQREQASAKSIQTDATRSEYLEPTLQGQPRHSRRIAAKWLKVVLGMGVVATLAAIAIFAPRFLGRLRSGVNVETGMLGAAYAFEDTIEEQFPQKGSLRIVSDRGAIDVRPSGSNSLRVVVHKKLYAMNQYDANSYNEGSKPQITVSGTAAILNANTNGAGDHGVSTGMDTFVPADATIDVASKFGDVNISSRKADAHLTVQQGNVTLNEISGSAKMNLDKGSIRATDISGDVEVDGRIDDVTLENVKGAVRLNGDFFDNVRLTKIGKMVEFKTARSDVTLASVPGALEISGDALRATNVVGPVRLVMRSKEIHLYGVSGDLEVDNSNGDIEIHPADELPIGKMTITGKHCDISLVLPANAGFQLNATTRKGNISSDFRSLKIDTTNGVSHATGTVGNAAAELQINADTGDIHIDKSQ